MFSLRRHQVLENLIWFGLSLILAIIVWITASLASNPITQRGIPDRIPIQILVDENVLITNNPTNRAFVIVRAPESTFEELATDDIQIVADLRGMTTFGRQTVPLVAMIAEQRRASIVTISPSQITVELQPRQEKFVPLTLEVLGEVPASVEAGSPTANITQVLVSGPASEVSKVAEAFARVNISNRRETFEFDAEIMLINDEGDPINGLTITPDTVGITVPLEQRSDVREFRVTPNIIGEPPEGYTLSADFNYTPETIFLTGPPDLLEELPGTLLTAPIDLSDRTEGFEIRVPVEIPNDNVVPITGQRITISVGITPIQSSRQFEGIPVEVISLPDGFTATIAPNDITVLINGPQLILTDLTLEDIRVIVDISDITAPGTYQLEPTATVNVAQIESDNISIIPTTVDVQVQPINSSD